MASIPTTVIHGRSWTGLIGVSMTVSSIVELLDRGVPTRTTDVVNILVVLNSITCMSTTVSAKIPEELKRELDEADVNVSEAIREALEEEVRRRRRERLSERAAGIKGGNSGSVDADEIADLVRADRTERGR